jgi:hypothetical protein
VLKKTDNDNKAVSHHIVYRASPSPLHSQLLMAFRIPLSLSSLFSVTNNKSSSGGKTDTTTNNSESIFSQDSNTKSAIINIRVPSQDQISQLEQERQQLQHTASVVPVPGSSSKKTLRTMNRNLRTAKGSNGGGSGASGLSLPAGSPEYVPGSMKSRGNNGGVSTGMADIYRQQQYFSRAMALDQMDLQAALDQMRTILSFSPQRVYKTSYYRKQTKNHWARDDPAFAMLELGFICIASIAYCVAFKRPTIILATLKFALQNILGIWLGLGIVVCTAGQFIANNYLSHHGGNSGGGNGNGNSSMGDAGGGLSSHHVKQGVEWLYAFDIHCNAFLPLFIVLCEFVLKGVCV